MLEHDTYDKKYIMLGNMDQKHKDGKEGLQF